MMTKSMGQDNPDIDSEGTDENGNHDDRTGDEDQQWGRWQWGQPQQGHHNTMTGMETEMHNNTTKTAVVHDEGDDEDGTRTKGAGNRYSTIWQTQNMAQETSLMFLGL
jgi:hypothetical protein